MTDPIDSAHLEQYVCGDDALRDEILTIFEEQAESWMKKLDPALDDEEWRNAAHALKGASRGVGAWAVGDLCEEAEALVDDFDDKTDRRQKHLQKLTVKMNEATSFARKLRDAS